MSEIGSRAQRHPASFRDPGSTVYEQEGRILRVLSQPAADNFRFLQESGLLRKLFQHGLIETTELDRASIETEGVEAAPAMLLEHRRIPYVSYPYEWPFRALQRAALFHLDLHLTALAGQATLSDASAYNVQFQGTCPIFIDVTSLRRYREGELWLAHRQFCEQFLNPLLLQSATTVPYHAWYRGSLEGISANHLAQVLPFRTKAHWLVFTHVLLHDRLQSAASRKATADLRAATTRPLSHKAFIAILEQLRRWIERLQPKDVQGSVWSQYETTRCYDDEAQRQKLACVAEFVHSTRPGMLWDLGCNAGEYSLEAVRSGAGYVVGFDYDTGALDVAFRRGEQQSAPFLPLFLDAANPSPSQGWRQCERAGFQQRSTCDAVLALAFEHHLTIGRNVPIPDFLEWLLGLAPRGLVEFVDKSDPTVRRMLAVREDIFQDYTLENFEQALAARSHIIKRIPLAGSGRYVYWYEK